MDAHRFDALIRALTVTGSRRTALTAALAGVFSQLGGEETAAHDARRRCKRIKDRGKRRKCLKRAKRHNATHHDQCAGKNVCAQGGAAACGAAGNECYCWVTPTGASVCGGNGGAFSATDCSECASAGRICVQGGGTFCEAGVICVRPCCPAGFRECGDRCVDVLNDPNNCGDCGRSCGIDRPNICAGGSCCIDAGGSSPCLCAPSGGACAPVGGSCCSPSGQLCTTGVCP